MKAVVIGARRARQGIGAFVGQALLDAGCELVGVVGTSPETVREPAEAFATRGYLDLADALKTERPDFVAICSPIEFHREHLELVADAGCHCLCDKPLWWDESASVDGLVDRFDAHGKHLALLTQWPHALPAYYRLHPDMVGEEVYRFRMDLGPASTGTQMVLDSVSHPLSMLERIAGPAPVTEAFGGAAGSTTRIDFAYGEVHVELTLTTSPTPPRPAEFAINERWARRVIEPEYQLFLEDKGRRVPMPDPMPLRVAEVVKAAREGLPTDRTSLVLGMANLKVLMQAVG